MNLLNITMKIPAKVEQKGKETWSLKIEPWATRGLVVVLDRLEKARDEIKKTVYLSFASIVLECGEECFDYNTVHDDQKGIPSPLKAAVNVYQKDDATVLVFLGNEEREVKTWV